jgi:uncharacterized YigZ family protein
MDYVETETSNTYEIKKSKFIAHLFPYTEFNHVMQRLKKEHPKARHFVYAYRYLNEFEQIVENSSDDGEPKGTSGKPSLAVLAGSGLINSGVIIIRYFGGVKLGTGGLVRAYSDAVNLVIEQSELKKYEKTFEKKIVFGYSHVSMVEYHINKLNIKVCNKEFNANVSMKISANQEALDKLISLLHSENILIED